jgi:hypothetical protein
LFKPSYTRIHTIDSDDVITERTLDTERNEPGVQIARLVADLENREPTELQPVYYSLDELLTTFFPCPPTADANASLVFTYEGYRFYVRQDGVTTVSGAAQTTSG